MPPQGMPPQMPPQTADGGRVGIMPFPGSGMGGMPPMADAGGYMPNKPQMSPPMQAPRPQMSTPMQAPQMGMQRPRPGMQGRGFLAGY